MLHPEKAIIDRLPTAPLACALAIGSFAVGTPAAAEAATQVLSSPPPTTAAEVQQFMPLSEATWPDSPCRGKTTFDIVPKGSFVDNREGEAILDGNCRFRLLNTLHGYRLCMAVVHETGHLDGQPHSNDPKSVMNGTQQSQEYAPCNNLTMDKISYSKMDLATLALSSLMLKKLPAYGYSCIENTRHPIICREGSPKAPWLLAKVLGNHTVNAQAIVKFIVLKKEPSWIKNHSQDNTETREPAPMPSSTLHADVML